MPSKPNYIFGLLFKNATTLKDASNLIMPTDVTPYCYYSMFEGCSSLTSAPALPCKSLSSYNYCYYCMFRNCSSLVAAPALPATSVSNYCYAWMFQNCTKMEIPPPELPFTSGVESCCRVMFGGCSSLESAPTLKATTMASNCYYQMFYNCKKINAINTRQTSFTGCTNWVNGVSSSGTFTCPSTLGTQASITRGTSGCPTNWTVINA